MNVKKEYDSRTKYFLKRLSILNSTYPIPLSIKACNLLINEMNSEKGFTRHNGQNYYVHPIALADTALDFGLVQQRWINNKLIDADLIITVCLLHDILEDVDWITEDYIVNEFGYVAYKLIDNVTKKEKTIETTEDYLERVASHEISALVKILDRLNNISTLSVSSIDHRHRQLVETKQYYIPLVKNLRHRYITDAAFYWQAYTIIVALCNEIERCDKLEYKS